MERNESDANAYPPWIACRREESVPRAHNRSVFVQFNLGRESQGHTVRCRVESSEYSEPTWKAKSRQATRPATEQPNAMMGVNFPRIEKLRTGRISALSSDGSVTHYFCQCQELGTNLQPGAAGGIGIDEKTDAIVLQSELDDTSRRGKIICFADDQDALAAKLDQDLGQMAALGSRDEQDLAAGDIRHTFYSNDTDGVICNELSS